MARLEDAQERHDVLPCRVPYHHGRVDEGLEDGSLSISKYLWRSAEDETGIVLEEVAGNGSDAVFLLGQMGEDVCQIGDIVGYTRETV